MGVTPRVAVALTIIGALLIVAGVAVLFWQLALILAGLILCGVGLFGVDVERGPR
jgi:hypothetical protein